MALRDRNAIAFVHCRVLPGGALAVLQDLISQYDNDGKLVVCALFSDRKELVVDGGLEIKIVTALPSWLNRVFHYLSFHKVPLFSFL